MILNENILQLTTGRHQGAHKKHREGFHCCVDLQLTCVCVSEVRYPHFILRTGEGVGAAKHNPPQMEIHTKATIQPQG